MQEKVIEIKSISYNFIMNIILKISQIIFPLITLPYVTRVLTAHDIGEVSFWLSFINYFCVFAQLGIPTYGIRACAKYRDNKEKLSKTVQEIMIINSVSVFIAYIMLFICVINSARLQENMQLLFIDAGMIALNSFGVEWFYQAIEQYQYITMRNIIFKIISLILMFLLVRNQSDYLIYGFLTIFSSVGANILNLWNIRKYVNFKKYSDYNISSHIKPIFVFFGLTVAVSIYANMDTVMLGFMSTTQEVAYYNLSTKVKLILAQMITALGPVLLPRMSNYIAKGKQKEYIELLKKSYNFVLIVVFPLVIFFIMQAPQVVLILGGEQYKETYTCMRIITLSLFAICIGNIACVQILAPNEMEFKTMISTICGAVINLGVNYILIPYYGACGTAIGTVITEFVVCAMQIYFARDKFKLLFRSVSVYKIIIASSIMLLCIYGLNCILNIGLFINFLIIGIASFGMYFITLIFLRENLLCDSIKKVRSYLKM